MTAYQIPQISDIVLYRVRKAHIYEESINCQSGILPAIVLNVYEDENRVDLKVFCNATFDVWITGVLFSNNKNEQGTWFLK